MPSGPFFPVDLGDFALQTDGTADYGRDVYDTQRGRRTENSPIIPGVEGFGRYTHDERIVLDD